MFNLDIIHILMSHTDWADRRVDQVRFLYAQKQQIAFYYLPKSSCTSLRAFLQLECNGGSNNVVEYHPSQVPRGTPLVALVRNPYERIVSGFMNRSHVLHPPKDYNKTTEGFTYFVKDLTDIPQDKVNVHFTPQYLLCGGSKPEHLYYMDDLDTFVTGMKQFGIQGEYPKYNVSSDNSVTPAITSFLMDSTELRTLVDGYYELDFRHLFPELVIV